MRSKHLRPSAILILTVGILCPVPASAQAPEPIPSHSLVLRLLKSRGNDYLLLRRELLAQTEAARSALERVQASEQLDARREALSHLLIRALADDSSWDRVTEVLGSIRERHGEDDVAGTSAVIVEREIRDLGEVALPAGTEILLARAAEPNFLIGLLNGLPAIARDDDPELCLALNSYLSTSDPDESIDRSFAQHAVLGLRATGTSCPGSVKDLALLIEKTDDADLGYAAVETLGWIGHRPQDILTIMELGANAEEDCLRRLLASAGNRIFDRMDTDASPSAKPDSP